MYYPWKAHVFIHLWNNVYNRWITSNFPFRWHRTTSTTSGWKSSIFNRNSSGERRLKFIASGEDDVNKKLRAKHREHRLAQRRQRVNTATTNMYKGSDKILQLHCKWSRWREGTPTAVASKSSGEIRQRLQFTVKATIGSNSYTICTMHVKNIFPTDWGQLSRHCSLPAFSIYTVSDLGNSSNLIG